MKERIALDCDGVILNHIETVEVFINNKLNINTKFSKKNLDNDLNISDKCFTLADNDSKSIRKNINKLLQELYQIPDFWETHVPLINKNYMNKLNKLYDIYIVTGIKEKFKENRIKNLYNIYNIDFSDKLFCTNGAYEDKSEIIKNINPISYTDDMIHHLLRLIDTNIKLFFVDNFNKYNVYKEKYKLNGEIQNINSLKYLTKYLNNEKNEVSSSSNKRSRWLCSDFS
jgi:hypothetical protein